MKQSFITPPAPGRGQGREGRPYWWEAEDHFGYGGPLKPDTAGEVAFYCAADLAAELEEGAEWLIVADDRPRARLKVRAKAPRPNKAGDFLVVFFVDKNVGGPRRGRA